MFAIVILSRVNSWYDLSSFSLGYMYMGSSKMHDGIDTKRIKNSYSLRNKKK